MESGPSFLFVTTLPAMESRQRSQSSTQQRGELHGKSGSQSKTTALIVCLMDNATDPQLLFNVVSTCSLAKETFEKWPRSYLLTALMGLPKDLRQLAAFYIEVGGCGRRPSYYDAKSWLLDDDSLLPSYVQNPLETLKRLATVQEAVDELAASDIWLSINTAPACLRPATETHGIKLALWRLQIYCALFQIRKPRVLSYEQFRAEDPLQVKLLRTFHRHELEELAQIYNDLGRILHHIYGHLLGSIFAEEYWRTEKVCKPEDWSSDVEHDLVVSAQDRFNDSIDFQISRGLPSLFKFYQQSLLD